MDGSRPYDDSELPWLAAVENEDGPRGVSARRMLAALIVVLLGLAVVAATLRNTPRRSGSWCVS